MGKSTFKKVALLAGVAAAVGYVAGLLTAPQSGKETRQDIKDATKSGLGQAEKQLKNASAELGSLVGEAKKRGDELSGKARKELEELSGKAQVAREKAREVLSAIHEGDAEDQDLKRAVEEANQSIKHLRAYLKK